MDVHLYVHMVPDQTTVDKLDSILVLLKQQSDKEVIMSKEMDDLTAEVHANTDVTKSALTLIQGFAARLDAAGTDPAKLQALKDELAANDAALAAAVAANTPAAPPA